MYEHHFATQRKIWNLLPNDDLRKQVVELTLALGGIQLDYDEPFPFETPDEVVQAIDQYLADNYDPHNFDLFEGLTKRQWRERAHNSIAGLTMFFQFVLNNTGVYLAWFSGKIGCPLNLSLNKAADSLVLFNGNEHLLVLEDPQPAESYNPYKVCAGNECFEFTFINLPWTL